MEKSDLTLFGAIVGLVIIVVFWSVLAGTPHITLPALLSAAANSSIAIAIVSTFFAAFAGTWGAQFLAERSLKRKELLSEIRGTNAAIGFAFNIVNTYVTMKKQLVREMVEEYERKRALWQNHLASRSGNRLVSNTFEIELRNISVPFSPTEELRKILNDRIFPSGRVILLLTPLMQSINGFANSINERSRWIEECKGRLVQSSDTNLHLYFGTSFAPGQTDEQYPGIMDAIKNQIDDCIAFSILITEQLQKHAEKLRDEYGQGAPKAPKPDFTMAGDLIPDMANYSVWQDN